MSTALRKDGAFECWLGFCFHFSSTYVPILVGGSAHTEVIAHSLSHMPILSGNTLTGTPRGVCNSCLVRSVQSSGQSRSDTLVHRHGCSLDS